MNTIQIPKSWYMNEENEIKWKYAWFSLQVFTTELTENDWIPNLCKSKGEKNNYWDLITFFLYNS